MLKKAVEDAGKISKGLASFTMVHLDCFPKGKAHIYTIGDTGAAFFHVNKDANGKYSLELYHTTRKHMRDVGKPHQLSANAVSVDHI
jgi:hypothetical protein